MGNLAMWVSKCVPPFSSHINLIGSVTNWSETDDTLWQPKMYWLTPNWCTLKSFLPQKNWIWIWIWCNDFLNVIFCSLVSAPGLMVVFSGQLGCKICPKLCNHLLPYNFPAAQQQNQPDWVSCRVAPMLYYCYTCVMLHWNGNIKLDWKWPFSRSKDFVKEICFYRHFFFFKRP